jgi:hypothetical protein
VGIAHAEKTGPHENNCSGHQKMGLRSGGRRYADFAQRHAFGSMHDTFALVHATLIATKNEKSLKDP